MRNAWSLSIGRALFVAAPLAFSACLSMAQQNAKPVSNYPLDLTVVKPETVGFSSERLERLHAMMQEAVDQKQLAGVVTILARHGKVIDYRTYGYRDLAAGSPMTKDVIFRDFSMTKPITGVAMMMLYEQGKWLPSDPIAKFIPEFAHLKVYKGVDSSGNMILTDPDHAPTMRELMTHTAGFTYGFFGDTPVDKMYRDANLLASANLQEFIDKLAKIPLLYQPGQGWTYSMSDGYRGIHRRKALGQVSARFHAREYLHAAGNARCGLLCSRGQARPLLSALSRQTRMVN